MRKLIRTNMAVIISKDEHGISYRGLSVAPDAFDKADKLDEYLMKQIPAIEKKLQRKGLLKKRGTRHGTVETWYEFGKLLSEIVDDETKVEPADKKYIWKAISLHASKYVNKKFRGSTRNHFVYCYRLSKFSKDFVMNFTWRIWSKILDSVSFREDLRGDIWLLRNVKKIKQIDNNDIRDELIPYINKVFSTRGRDFSRLSDAEYFSALDKALADFQG